MTPYAHCSPPGEIKFTGTDSILGRSVVLHKESDRGAGYSTSAEKDAMACGTITTFDFNPMKNLIPYDAKDSDGDACSDLGDWEANNN